MQMDRVKYLIIFTTRIKLEDLELLKGEYAYHFTSMEKSF